MLAPHELNKSFQKSVMGYNQNQLDNHIRFIIEKYTEVYNANTELEQKLKTVLAKLEELKAEEDSIRGTLIKSQNIGEKIIKDAKERADIIQGSVEESCNEIIAKFRSQLNAEKNELLNMRASILEFRKEIYDLYKAHIFELQNLPIGALEENRIVFFGNIPEYDFISGLPQSDDAMSVAQFATNVNRNTFEHCRW